MIKITDPEHIAALTQAANFLECHPERYNFMDGRLSNGCGCALAWAGHFLQPPIEGFAEVARTLGVSSNVASEMSALRLLNPEGDRNWTDYQHAETAVKYLRHLAAGEETCAWLGFRP